MPRHELDLEFEPVAANLGSPVGLTHAGDGSGRLFIVEQTGGVKVHDGTQVRSTPFLDVSALITCCGERGLLGLAFHPDYEVNGFFYVHYTNTAGNSVVTRYQVSADPNVADPTTAHVVLTVTQPAFTNHKGGQLAFGPDRYLYVGLGDGGSGGDPGNRAQNLGELLGKILRVDVDGASAYVIPSTNPFRTLGARPEIWAYGLRNPWRFSFDRHTGDLSIADVGQSAREEVNFQSAASPGGENYGWRRMEGTACFNPSSACNDGTLTLPVFEYDHSLGCSITGGYRYRGVVFTDDPLVADVTSVKAVHVTELRAAIDRERMRRSLPAFAWTDAPLTSGATSIRAIHVTELRAALTQACQAAARTPPTYTDPALTVGLTPVRAPHIAELRAAVRALQ